MYFLTEKTCALVHSGSTTPTVCWLYMSCIDIFFRRIVHESSQTEARYKKLTVGIFTPERQLSQP